MPKSVRKRNTKAIIRLTELLPNVLDSFGWYGIGTGVSATEQEAEPGEAEGAEGEAVEGETAEEEEEPVYYVDPDDVQGALYEVISTIIDEGLIPEFRNPKKQPSLANIFGVLFGTKSELVEQASYFEDLISGYMDKAHIDDLREACVILGEMIGKIESITKKQKHEEQ